MNKWLLAALALMPVVAIGGEQVILEKDFGGKAMRKVKHVDGWSLASYCPGELSREQGTLKLKALPNNGKASAQMLCAFRTGNLTSCEIKLQYKVKGSGKIRFGAIRTKSVRSAKYWRKLPRNITCRSSTCTPRLNTWTTNRATSVPTMCIFPRADTAWLPS